MRCGCSTLCKLALVLSPLHYRTLGTPNETVWPGVTKLPDFKPHFPKWPAKPADKAFPKFTGDALDLLTVSRRAASGTPVLHPTSPGRPRPTEDAGVQPCRPHFMQGRPGAPVLRLLGQVCLRDSGIEAARQRGGQDVHSAPVPADNALPITVAAAGAAGCRCTGWPGTARLLRATGAARAPAACRPLQRCTKHPAGPCWAWRPGLLPAPTQS